MAEELRLRWQTDRKLHMNDLSTGKTGFNDLE